MTLPIAEWDRPWLYPVVRVDQMPRLLEQMVENGVHATFAALMFKSPNAPAGEDPVVNLQYSIEHGIPGFDWVLLSVRNIADQVRVRVFLEGAGYTVMDRTMNGVRFLRVVAGDLAGLGMRLCTEVYGLALDADLSLVAAGFEYEPDAQSAAVEAHRLTRYFVLDDGVPRPARQLDHYSVPEVWTAAGWQPYQGAHPWSAVARELTREAFEALCRDCVDGSRLP